MKLAYYHNNIIVPVGGIFNVKIYRNKSESVHFTMIRIVCEQMPCLVTASTREGDVVICFPALFIRNLRPFSMTTGPLTTCHCIFLTLYFYLTKIFRAVSTRYHIQI